MIEEANEEGFASYSKTISIVDDRKTGESCRSLYSETKGGLEFETS